MQKFREGSKGRTSLQILGEWQTYWGNGQREIRAETEYFLDAIEVEWICEEGKRIELIDDPDEIKDILNSFGPKGDFYMQTGNGGLRGHFIRAIYSPSSSGNDVLFFNLEDFEKIGRKQRMLKIETFRGLN